MAGGDSNDSPNQRHQRTRTNRQKAGMVAVQLLLPPELARRLDGARGQRPRTEVALEWLLAQSGLDAATTSSPLKRGRPRKPVVSVPSTASQTPPSIVELVSLELVDWERLLSRIQDPRKKEDAIPVALRCWRLEGADGNGRLRWVYLDSDDPRIRFVKNHGGKYRHESEYFDGKGAWVLPPEQADACIKRFRLVNLQPLSRLAPDYNGWQVEVIDCGLTSGVLFEVRLDFEAALQAVNGNPSRALGLASYLECRLIQGHAWYRVREEAADLSEGTLVSEPFTADELNTNILSGLNATGVRIFRRSAPQPLREAWAAVVLRGNETTEGLVRPEPHTGCPGHRLGSLLPAYVEAVHHGREPLLLRSEWELIVQRAVLLGVATELVPRTPSALSRAFDPTCLPGWDTPARGGHCLYPFQRQAVEFALDQDVRCLVGDEMGLGKTASAIATASAAAFRRVVVICPLNAVGVWQREIVAWSSPDHEEPRVTVIRATDQLPLLPSVGWTLLGYETLAGRDERVLIDESETKNALSAFFVQSLGNFRKVKRCGWKVGEVRISLADLAEAENTVEQKKRWALTLQATPAVADAVGRLLAEGSRVSLGSKLRARFERAVKRLRKPVMAGLQAWDPDLIIADEAHRLKEAFAHRTRAVRELSTGRRVLLLTGTPLRNHAVDGKALLEVILPERIWTAMGRSGESVISVVSDLLKRRMIRRRKQDVLTELPLKRRQRIPVRLEAAALKAYVGAMYAAEDLYRRTLIQTGSSNDARNAALGKWAVARKELGLAKLNSRAPADLIEEVVAEKGCVIVFAHHHEVLDGLERMLTNTGVEVGRVDGRIGPDARAETVRRFQEGEFKVFLGGIHASGEAITLTRADTVVFVELDWVPGMLLQAEDRGHRAGQTSSSYHIIHLTAEIVPPEKPSAVPEPIPPAETMPEDMRRYEEEGLRSPELEDATMKLEEDIARWEDYWESEEEVGRLESVENIDEHMIAALDAKTRHIDAVLGEKSDPLVAETASDDIGAMAHLAQATEHRIRLRQQTAAARATR